MFLFQVTMLRRTGCRRFVCWYRLTQLANKYNILLYIIYNFAKKSSVKIIFVLYLIPYLIDSERSIFYRYSNNMFLPCFIAFFWFGVKIYEKDSMFAFRRKTVHLFVFVLRFYINVVKKLRIRHKKAFITWKSNFFEKNAEKRDRIEKTKRVKVAFYRFYRNEFIKN